MSRAHHLPEDPPRKDRSKPNARSAAHLGYGNTTRRPALDGQIHLLAPDPRCWCPSLLHGSGSTRRTSGIPPTFAGSLAILFVLVPLEIGYLLYLGRRRNGCLSLAGVARYRARSAEHTSALQSRQYLVCRLPLDTNISYAG